MLPEQFAQLAVDHFAVRPPPGLPVILRVVELRALHDLFQVLPEIVRDHRDDYESVGRGEGVIGNVHEVRIPDRVRVLAGQEIHGRHVVQHGDLAVQHGNVHVLALSASLPLQQGCLHADGREHAAPQISDGYPGAYRVVRIRAGNGHAAAHGLRHLVESRPIRPGSVGTESRDGAGHDPGVEPAEGPVIDFQALGHADAKIADDHVRVVHEIVEHLEPAFALQIQRHTLLVAVEGDEIGAHAIQ